MNAVAGIALGMTVVLLLTAATAYFVAQEFGYMAVDRGRLAAAARGGDASAGRALGITRRTSFMLSGAQLGITVTGLLVGYVAEPLIGDGLGGLLGGAGVPRAVGITVGTVLALGFSTVVQMVLGELFPKNLAIARPDQTARRLARSTRAYLTVFGPLIRLFDKAAELLLKAVRIEPVHDVEHAATPQDLARIVRASRDSGDLPAELSALLDRTLELPDRPAGHAMAPRTRVVTVGRDEPVTRAVELMAGGVSRLPVVGDGVDDVVGVLCLRDVLALPSYEVPVHMAARPALLVPESLPLTAVLLRLREADEELACVLDEYGGLAGVITVEDVAEELIGEIADEHDPASVTGGRTFDGATPVDEAGRLLGRDLPSGEYETLAGLVIARLGRLPAAGESVTVDGLELTVRTVGRRVPALIEARAR